MNVKSKEDGNQMNFNNGKEKPTKVWAGGGGGGLADCRREIVHDEIK